MLVAGFFALGFFADTERVSFHWPLPGYLALLPLLPLVLSQWPRWLRSLTWGTTAVGLVLTLLNGIYFAVIWGLLDWLTNDFLRKTIPDRDMLVLLWGAYSMVNMVRDMYLSSMLALERFRILTWLTALTAVVALVVMWPALHHFGLRGAIYGLMAGEVTYLVLMLVLIAQSFRQQPKPEPA